MKDSKDEEMKRIEEAKLKEMMQKTAKKETESSSDKPVTVTDTTFKETVKSNTAVVVDCWAAWCGPCRMMGPIIDEMASDHRGKILFGKLNVDENPEVTCEYQIMSIPTLLVFKNGQLVERIVGVMPKPMLEERINRCLC